METDERVWRDGMGIAEYAELWVDMAPHWQQLVRLATGCQNIVELGVRGGVSTACFLVGLDRKFGALHSVDIDENVRDMVPPWVRDDPRWTLRIADSKDIKLSGDIDLMFIDTSHTYEQTRAELTIAMNAFAKKIVLHDYLDSNYPGVAQAVHEALRVTTGLKLTVYSSKWGLAVLELDR